MVGSYFGGKASEGKGFDVDIDIPTKEATPATEGSFAGGGLAPLLGEPTYADDNHRVPYKDGRGPKMSRRNFLKIMVLVNYKTFHFSS